MPTYITLLRWTSQGAKSIKESPSRLDAARKAFQAVGATLKDFYMVTGRYDMVIIAEAPNDYNARKSHAVGCRARQRANRNAPRVQREGI